MSVTYTLRSACDRNPQVRRPCRSCAVRTLVRAAAGRIGAGCRFGQTSPARSWSCGRHPVSRSRRLRAASAHRSRLSCVFRLGRAGASRVVRRGKQGHTGDRHRLGTAASGCAPRKGKTLMPTRKFEITDYLRTDRQIAAYLDAALSDGDPRVLLQAVRDVAAVRGGMAALARRAGIPRESLYRMLSSRGNPSYVAVRSILGAVGFRLSVEPGIKRPSRSSRAA